MSIILTILLGFFMGLCYRYFFSNETKKQHKQHKKRIAKIELAKKELTKRIIRGKAS